MGRWRERRRVEEGNRTFRSGSSTLNASQTLLELGLGSVELGEGRRQVLELLVQLLLNLGELLGLERVEVDYARIG